MPVVRDCIDLLNFFAPEEKSEDYDNAGLIVGHYNNPVDKVLCCLDVTESVLSEAVSLGASMVISHHPMVFYPLKKINDSFLTGQLILSAAEKKIAVYSAHTNLDKVKNGINDFTAELIGLKDIRILEKTEDLECGIGRTGYFKKELTLLQLSQHISKCFSEEPRLIGDPDKYIKKLAVINGAGGGDSKYIDRCIETDCHCLVTAEVKHHVALYALSKGFNIIELSHYSMEKCYINKLVKMLTLKAQEKGLIIEFISSQVEKSPYYQNLKEQK